MLDSLIATALSVALFGTMLIAAGMAVFYTVRSRRADRAQFVAQDERAEQLAAVHAYENSKGRSLADIGKLGATPADLDFALRALLEARESREQMSLDQAIVLLQELKEQTREAAMAEKHGEKESSATITPESSLSLDK